MKKVFALCAALFLTVLPLFALPAFSREDETVSDLIDERKVHLWYEGQRFGDNMVIGARGVVTVIYVDGKFFRAVAREGNALQWIRETTQYFGNEDTKGKKYFIVSLEVYKPWDFDYSLLTVGDYRVSEKDVISSISYNPEGTLESGSEWHFAFVVPESEVKPGKEVKIGYGDDSVIWKVPK